MQQFLELTFLQNTLGDYLVALLTLGIGILITKVLQAIIISRIKHWARRTETMLDDDFLKLFEQFVVPLIYLGLVYASLRELTLYRALRVTLDAIGVILLTIIVIRMLGALVEYGIRFYAMTQRSDNPNFEHSLNAIAPAIKVVFWIVGAIFLLDNLGFDISAMIAGLGVGGVAVALASQGILQDLFSYFSILFDRPFEIGDFVIVGDCIGTVEYVGIKTTRMRSLDGEQLVIANTDLTSSRIRNYKRMLTRRIVMTIGVTYETGLEQLESIPAIVQDVVDQTENVTFDRAHFATYGDFSLNYEIVYIVTSGDYALYMDVQQAINLALKREFEARHIEFAYPTQVTYWSQLAESNNGSGIVPPVMDGVDQSSTQS